jgi:hypothetical protein
LLSLGRRVAEDAFELAREVASDPGGEIGAIDGAEVGARGLGGGQAAFEDAREEVLVDPFAKRGWHGFTLGELIGEVREEDPCAGPASRIVERLRWALLPRPSSMANGAVPQLARAGRGF